VDSAFWGWNDIWLSKEFLKWNIGDYVTKIHSPILVVQSSDDPYGTLAQVDAIEKLSSGKTARAILEHCGHSPHVDQKQKTIDAIERFVLSLT
jgi:pimeloyl-ACP methyl ester carboxylesterase